MKEENSTTSKTRHPATGHLIENESEWKNKKGEWLEVESHEVKDAAGKIIQVNYTPIPDPEDNKEE